jgi:hypothetical protein
VNGIFDFGVDKADNLYLTDFLAFLKTSPEPTDDDIFQYVRRVAVSDTYFLGKYILQYDRLRSHLHRALCSWVDEHERDYFYFIYPGQHYKTTVGKSYLLRRIIKNPNIRILLGSSSEDNSMRIMQEIQQHFQKNPRFRTFFPELIPKSFDYNWGKERMLVPRDRIYSEMTMEICGIDTKLTSRHYDLVFLTDIIEQRMAASVSLMEYAREWFGLLRRIVDQEGGQIAGESNRWAEDDVAGEIIATDCKQYINLSTGETFGDPKGRFYVLERQAREKDKDNNWKPILPEVYTNEFYDFMEKNYPTIYDCQYMNEPKIKEGKSLKKDWLRYWRPGDEGPYFLDGEFICHWHELVHDQLCDPAQSKRKQASRAAIIVTAIVPRLRLVLVRKAWAGRVEPSELVSMLLDNQLRYRIRTTAIEQAGNQSLSHWTEVMCKEKKLRMNVQQVTPSNVQKEVRIVSYLEPYFSSGRILFGSDMGDLESEYLSVSSTERKRKQGRSLDLMDALAYGPEIWEFPAVYTGSDLYEEYVDQITGRDPVTGY